MGLELKGFQKEALRVLRGFLEDALFHGNPEPAFRKWAGESRGGLFREYRALEGLAGVPSVCVRLPTGGGKTLLAASAVGVIAESYLGRAFPLVLWLAPSDAIRTQTLRALKEARHPYREALLAPFGGQARVFDVAEFEQMRPQDLQKGVCVLVGTMQALQVTNTDGRRVYAHNENLEGFFRGVMAPLAARTAGLELIEEGKAGAGTPRFSLANLLKVQRPVVVLDEAHKFVTELAREVRKRIGPSVVLELTATPPEEESNVLYRASAAQLRDEDMIKLPVVLEEHRNSWQEAVGAAVKTRRSLEELARGELGGARPVLLIQTQSAGQEADWRTVRQHLIETERLSEGEIAVETQDRKELKGVDLLAPGCPVTTVLTVRALMEGWDCPTAYVLCSTAKVRSRTDVEQLLGRVLRMPGARKKAAEELNRAYAHVACAEFREAALALQEALVHQGFEPKEARAAVETPRLPMETFRPALRAVLERRPELEGVAGEARGRIAVEELDGGAVEVTAEGPLGEEAAEALVLSAPEPGREALRARIAEHNEQWTPAPSERGVSFRVPRLVIDVEGERVLFDAETAQEARDWDLLDHPADISGFDYDETTRAYTLDLEGQRFTLMQADGSEQLPLLQGETTVEGLAAWLGRRLRDPGLRHDALRAWVLGALKSGLERPRLSVEVLDRGKYILLRKLKELLQAARQEEAEKGCALLLKSEVVTDSTDEFAFEFAGKPYPANWLYEGRQRFRKHYFPVPGELGEDGEELACAVELEGLPEVRYWVRNLEGPERRGSSMWLQTPKRRFYPDFVALLTDGRVFAVEYKGQHLRSNEDSELKNSVGKLWADKSGGRAVFAMVEKVRRGLDMREQMREAIRAPARGLY